MATSSNRRAENFCLYCECQSRCILSTLTPEELSAWNDLSVPRTFPKSDVIFWEDDVAEGLYLICAGAVKLIKSIENGDQQILRLVGPGSFFGLPPLIIQRTHFATCQTIAHTRIRFIARKPFLDFLEKFPRFTVQFVGQLSEELGSVRLRLLEFSQKNGKERVADLLLRLGRKFGTVNPRGVVIDLDLSRADLGGMAGLTPETTIRILSQFRRQGMVAADRGKRILLLDQESLRDLAGHPRQSDLVPERRE